MLEEITKLMEDFDAFDDITDATVQQALRDYPVRMIPTKWVLVSKIREDILGQVVAERKKARLVACEATDRFTVRNTWSPTITIDSVRLLLALAARYCCRILCLDVSSAYLRGKPRGPEDDLVFLRLPPGLDRLFELFANPRFSYSMGPARKFWRLKANLYGCQDAGARFYQLFRDWLLEIGYAQCSVDPCVFYLHRGPPHNDFSLQGAFVDDAKVI